MADIDLAQLTNSTALTDGSGVFDTLQKAVERHIEAQFVEGRLAGTDYANVYLGAMQSVLQQSVQFLLSEQEAGHKADLVEAQNLDQRAKTDIEWYGGIAELRKQWGYLATEGAEYDIQSIADQGDGLIDQQIANTQDDTENKNWLTQAQLDKQWGFTVTATGPDITAITPATDGLIDEQIIEVQEKVDLLQSQDLEVIAATTRQNNESTAQIAKINRDTEVIGYKTISELEKQWGYTVTRTNDAIIDIAEASDGLIDQQLLNEIAKQTLVEAQTDAQLSGIQLSDQKRFTEEFTTQIAEYNFGTVLPGQVAKAASEKALLDQKAITELAQVSDTDIGAVQSGTGVLGKQRDLYDAQRIGFKGKHLNDTIKLHTDTFSLVYSILDGTLPANIEIPTVLYDSTAQPTDVTHLDALITEAKDVFDSVT